MRRVGQTRKRDALEPYVVEALQEIGVQCWKISAKGVGDLLTYQRGVWLPIEVKSATGALTPAQIQARSTAPYPVVRSVADALALFGVRA